MAKKILAPFYAGLRGVKILIHLTQLKQLNAYARHPYGAGDAIIEPIEEKEPRAGLIPLQATQTQNQPDRTARRFNLLTRYTHERGANKNVKK